MILAILSIIGAIFAIWLVCKMPENISCGSTIGLSILSAFLIAGFIVSTVSLACGTYDIDAKQAIEIREDVVAHVELAQSDLEKYDAQKEVESWNEMCEIIQKRNDSPWTSWYIRNNLAEACVPID